MQRLRLRFIEHIGRSIMFYLNQRTGSKNSNQSRLELKSEDWGKQTIETLENLDNSFLRIRDVFIREIGEENRRKFQKEKN
jgi:hypothetical protein